jgi:hypothetical protein
MVALFLFIGGSMYIFCVLLLLVSACSFKPENLNSNNLVKSNSSLNSENGDSDGDMVNDEVEVARGRNPLVADIPILKVNFLQNYKIQVSANKTNNNLKETFVIDTKVLQNEAGFKYRIGKQFSREIALNTAASNAKFSGHSVGKIENHDFSWIKYPELTPDIYSKEILKNIHFFGADYSGHEITVNLENSIRLEEISLFNQISNLEVNYYYFDYEKDSYELIGEASVERVFKRGVYELFQVNLENLPVNLIKENYMRKGEFIISEVKDYFIPDLNMKYSELINSIQAKTIELSINFPNETQNLYVSTSGGDDFISIMTKVFGDNFTIKENNIFKIREFENNLPAYLYLNELKEKDKFGRWFALTSNFSEHFLKHKFSNEDYIVLSYGLGNDLSKQVEEKVISYLESEVSEGKNEAVITLGNISTNSQVNFQIKPDFIWGTKVNLFPKKITWNLGAGDWATSNFTYFEPVSLAEGFQFSEDNLNFQKNIKLIINNSEFNLLDLVQKKYVELKYLNGNINFSIPDINTILKLSTVEENNIKIKLVSFSDITPVGWKFENWTANNSYNTNCLSCAVNMMLRYIVDEGQNRLLSEDSLRFNEWAWGLDTAQIKPYNFRTAKNLNYSQNLRFKITSTISNYYN